MFRRRIDPDGSPASAPSAPSAPAEPGGRPGGKGRPTPKRRDAERRNRQPITAPRNRKDAYRQTRERQARDRQRAREGMARGDTRYLLKRDQGPVRQFARDYIDARRTFGEIFMFVALIFVVLTWIPVLLPVYGFGGPLLLLLIVGESIFLSTRVKRLARERFPGEDVRGIGMYAVTRSMQIRRLRVPKPRLKPGDKDKV